MRESVSQDVGSWEKSCLSETSFPESALLFGDNKEESVANSDRLHPEGVWV